MSTDTYPCIRYDDAPAAVRWLVGVLGFAEHEIMTGDDGVIDHGELRFGDGFVMIGARRRDTPYAKAVGDLGPAEMYLATDDIAAAHERAVAAGADVVMPLEDRGYSVGFTVRDPEGNIWSLGTYRPAQP